MAWVNEDLARQFAEIAELLRLRGDDLFRVRAYERAAEAIGAAPVDLSTLTDVTTVKGIGSSTAAKINEYLATGSIRMLEELRADVPAGVVALTAVPGVGPKMAQQLYDVLGVDSVEALEAAIETQAVRALPGMGAKTEQNLLDAIARMGAKDTRRVPAADALAISEELRGRLARVQSVEDVVIAGSLRRMRETIGDVDLLAAATDAEPVMRAFRDDSLVRTVLAAGPTKTSVITARNLQVDLRVVAPQAWGAALVYFTGSKAHNVRIRERAVRRGLTLNEYGLHDKDSGQRLASRTEEDVYAALGLPWIPPPLREDRGEVDAAADGSLPKVVTVDDLRGDLHGHSDWSGDGKASLEDMVAAAAQRGYEYWAVTDHAENLSINGLTRERFLERRREIGRLQERYNLRILDGVELNIGIDGSLDYDLEFLLQFDFCVASVHTLMRRGEQEQTERILAAMRHPAVNVIGHPTGRKIGRRPGYDVDLDRIVTAAVETGTALEVNASPRRLDLSGDGVRRAVEAGAKLAISCDAHSIGDLGSMPYGVATAQRGWATPADVLNCRDTDGLLTFVAAKR